MSGKRIALVLGDGAGPEMMNVACIVALEAAKLDGLKIEFEETPMGWNAFEKFGDTLPKKFFDRAVEIGTIFFGGVGDPKFDNTIGVTRPELKPEARALLSLRKSMGLLLNFRPMVYYPGLCHLTNVKPEMVPEHGIQQVWIRFLLQDSYFGTADLGKVLPGDNWQMRLGVKSKSAVSGTESIVCDLAYYERSTVEAYFRAAFKYARSQKLPLISIDKANVMARYDFWRRIATAIGKEFPDVLLSHQYVDSANALLFTPAKLNGVIACGNEHGDILSDGAAAALGSMGLMCSSAINPATGAAMFESGAGTAPTLAGKDVANPIGRILSAALMLRHIGAEKGATAIEVAVRNFLQDGFRTGDLAQKNDDPSKVLGTSATGKKICSFLQ
jgi:3-isopropylmalate dehydrogenase